MKKYRLYDDYDFSHELLGEFDTMQEVKTACKKRDEETDGEWEPLLYKWNERTQKYHLIEDWSY